MPERERMREFIKTVLYFNQVAHEENLINSLIKESMQCIDNSQLEEALSMLQEANSMDKWKELYGPQVLSNLSYCYALKGNFTLAKQYFEEYRALYGDLGFDNTDHQKLTYVS